MPYCGRFCIGRLEGQTLSYKLPFPLLGKMEGSAMLESAFELQYNIDKRDEFCHDLPSRLDPFSLLTLTGNSPSYILPLLWRGLEL